MVVLIRMGVPVRSLVFQVIRASLPFDYGFVTVNHNGLGLRFYVHYEAFQVIDELLLLNQYAEAFKLKPCVVVDVGAHVGAFTIPMAKGIMQSCGKGLVMAIEPVSINYRALVNNIKVNDVENVVLPVKAAVDVKRGVEELGWVNVRERVNTITMDDVLRLMRGRGYDNVDLVKIDIEGAELGILTLNTNWLRHVKALVMELHPSVYGIKGLRRIVSTLEREGFNVIHVKSQMNTRQALKKWIENINPSPQWLTLLLWKTLVSMSLNQLEIDYWYAVKEEKLT